MSALGPPLGWPGELAGMVIDEVNEKLNRSCRLPGSHLLHSCGFYLLPGKPAACSYALLCVYLG